MEPPSWDAGVMDSILKQLESHDPVIRKNAIQLITTLMQSNASNVQQTIINLPTGLDRIVHLLQDPIEAIRNDAVLLLSELSRGSCASHEILTSENVFQLLFNVIKREKLDSIVVEDCAVVMLNLLRDNPRNQVIFAEESLVKNLVSLTSAYTVPESETEEPSEFVEWNSQKIANFIYITQILRIMIVSIRGDKDNHLADDHRNIATSESRKLLTNQFATLFVFLKSELSRAFHPYGEFTEGLMEKSSQELVELSEKIKQLENQLDHGYELFEEQTRRLQAVTIACEAKDARIKELEQELSKYSIC